MEMESLLRALLALVFVLGLVGFMGYALKRWGASKFAGRLQDGRRLKMIEQLWLDPKRKLVLVQYDAQEHLLLVGEQQVLEISRQSPVVSKEEIHV